MRVDPRFDGLCGRAGFRPSVAVVAAHPDDETIGAGAALRRWSAACHVIHVTDGAPRERRLLPPCAAALPREAYARVRREEAEQALAMAGVGADRIHRLEHRDQEAVYELVAIAERLAAIFAAAAPDVVVTHAYEGGHPDHDATAFAVQAATTLAAAALRRKARPLPLIVEMTGYHARDGITVRGAFLPHPDASEAVVDLTTDERRHKRAMLEAFVSQREVLAPFVVGVAVERFRVAPRYDFAAPPHRGSLHYELGALGPLGTTWRAFVRAASRALGLPQAASHAVS